MIRQTPYSKENEQKNNSEHSANRALPPSGEPEGASGVSFISHSLSLPLQSVSAVLTLLNEGCTIPFISRYRKERTGGLDEVQITDISELYDRLKELGKRKETILKTIREQEKLTPELEARIRACMDSTELEDIYLPYKPKRRTRAQIAREQGLEPLALAIMEEAQKPTAPPDLPEGGGDKLASILQKYQGRAKESLSSRVRIGTPPLSGRSGGAPLPLSGESEGASIFLVSEDGASIYSASPVAREEFPDEDVTTRGAISIGRRLMDPLAELVKIDPKSIGVGQYQHDVDQSKLKHSLDQTVKSCVNQVRVNLNTASLHLLTYVSGLGPALARNIIDYRREHGPFTSRAQLKKVKRLGDTAYQQCAGFLRIPNAKNPLDNSAVHPESYHIVEQMAKDLKCTIKDLIGNKKLLAEIDVKRYLTPQPPLRRERGSEASPNPSERRGGAPPNLPEKGGVPMRTREDKGALNLSQHLSEVSASLPPLPSEGSGEATLRDILTELEKPGRDPRGEVEVFEFDKNVHTLSDLIIGMELPGIVTNITNFGAFVDIGVHQDGLVHISQLSDRFVTDPTQVIRLHQHVRVRVVEVDMRRKRIALSMKNIKQ